MLLAINLHKDIIDVEGIAIDSVFSPQSTRANSPEFDKPKADSLASDSETTFCKEILDVAVTEIETIVEPDGVTDDVRWEAVAFVSVNSPILAISGSYLPVPEGSVAAVNIHPPILSLTGDLACQHPSSASH